MALAHLSVSIAGFDRSWIISKFSLRQVFNDHHVFEIAVTIPEPAKGNTAFSQESLIQIIGQNALISIRRDDSRGGDCKFEGFVDQVLPSWTSRACFLRITGYSKTMLMDCGPRFRTFSDRDIAGIVQKITANYKLPLSLRNVKGKTAFSVQSQETDYRYLCRLAGNYGNAFFFDGEQLHLGSLEHETSNNVTLEFGEDLKQAALSFNASPLNFQVSGYQIESNRLMTQSCVNQCHHTDPLSNAVAQRSYATYPAYSIHLYNAVLDLSEIKNRVNQLLTRQVQELVRLNGASDIPGLKIGSKISITGSDEVFAGSQYVIIEITHNLNNDRSYNNTFTAIPTGYPFPAGMQNSNRPVCGPLIATVKEHNDPQKLGRIKVQFVGDPEQTLSPWLRVLTPYTGFGGMYFLPEKGDQVIVFSEDLNIEKSPFVLPAFYHGNANAQQWYDPENKRKGFTTEKIVFKIDDRTGKLYIEADEIEMVSRKKMKLDGGKEMGQKAKVFEAGAEQQMSIDGGVHLTLKGKRIDLNP